MLMRFIDHALLGEWALAVLGLVVAQSHPFLVSGKVVVLKNIERRGKNG